MNLHVRVHDDARSVLVTFYTNMVVIYGSLSQLMAPVLATRLWVSDSKFK